MGNIKKATCPICGNEYDLCLSCRKELSVNPWKEVADTPECYKLFLCLLQYNNGYTGKEEAKKQLETIKYDVDNLRDNIKDKIKEILATEKSPKKATIKEESK